MGTRGLYGFRCDGIDYLSYRQCDGYPTGAGRDLMEETRALLKLHGVDGLKKMVVNLPAAHEDGIPTDAHRRRAAEVFARRRAAATKKERKFLDALDGMVEKSDYYGLVRAMQGSVIAMLDLGFRLAARVDDYDDLDWVSVADLDRLQLEIHRARTPKTRGFGRYASVVDGTTCISLVCTLPLQGPLPKDWDGNAHDAGNALAWGVDQMGQWRTLPYDTAFFLAQNGPEGILEAIQFDLTGHQRAELQKIKTDARSAAARGASAEEPQAHPRQNAQDPRPAAAPKSRCAAVQIQEELQAVYA